MMVCVEDVEAVWERLGELDIETSGPPAATSVSPNASDDTGFVDRPTSPIARHHRGSIFGILTV